MKPDVAKTGHYIVMCRRHDGRERVWNSYVDHAEAEAIAKRLTVLGCESRVVDNNDPKPEGDAT